MSNPLVDRILNNPLTFVAAKNKELEDLKAEASSYIVLSAGKKSIPISSNTTSAPVAKMAKRVAPKTRSLAETLAAYTGKKYRAKNDRKQKLKEAREVNAQKHMDDSSDDTQYESASEFQTDNTDLSFQGFKSSPDDGVDVSLTSNTEDIGEAVSDSETPGSVSETETITMSSEIRGTSAKSPLSRNAEASATSSSSAASSSSSDQEASSEASSQESDSEDLGEVVNGAVFDAMAPELIGGLTTKAAESDKGDDEEEESDADADDSEDPDVLSDADEHEQEEEDIEVETGFTGEELSQLKEDLLKDAKTAIAAETDKNENITPSSPQELPPTPPDMNDHYKVGETPKNMEETSRISTVWSPGFEKKRCVGLINFGVTCYMNSAIQTMVHIPAVQLYLMEIQANKHKQISPRSVSYTLAELASRMWNFSKDKRSDSKYIKPKKMVQRLEDINCMMSEWQQEDSHEYFMSLMSRLQEDSTPKGKKLNESIIYDIFGGLLEQEVICQECKSVSLTKQEFYDLSLGFNKRRLSNDAIEDENAPKYSIERAIRDFFSLETIRTDKNDPSSGYFCEKCHKKTIATKKSTIEKSPQTLLVHMKRFKFNGNSSLKVKQPILYQKYLNLEKFSSNGEPIRYQLIGVIVHEGRSILSGHYVAHCMRPDGSWATYDDEYINLIDERQAMTDPSAYCLLYTKLQPKGQKRGSEVKHQTKSKKRSKL